jgi:carboxylesterase type B
LFDLMTAAWGRFARSGDPAGDGLAWPRHTRDGDAHAILDLTPAVGHALMRDVCDFWDTHER